MPLIEPASAAAASPALPGAGPGCARSASPTFSEAPGAGGNAVPIETMDQIVPAHLLDGDEVVLLAMKPSLWFVVFVSARWVIVLLAVILMAGYQGHMLPFVSAAVVAQSAAALIVARLMFACMQWVSRLYILTNRRVLRVTGVFNIDVFECPLSKIQNTYLTLTWYERLVRVGTIGFATAGTGGIEATWRHIGNPLEVHERVRSAIHRAQRPSQGL